MTLFARQSRNQALSGGHRRGPLEPWRYWEWWSS